MGTEEGRAEVFMVRMGKGGGLPAGWPCWPERTAPEVTLDHGLHDDFP